MADITILYSTKMTSQKELTQLQILFSNINRSDTGNKQIRGIHKLPKVSEPLRILAIGTMRWH